MADQMSKLVQQFVDDGETIEQLRARIEQLQQDNEQLRLSLQASAFVQERAKVERLEAELRAVNTDNAILRERNSELRKGNSAEVARLTAENAGLREQLMYARSCTDGQCGSQQCIRCAEDPNGDDPKAYEGTGSWKVT